jgi:hypothetical protein
MDHEDHRATPAFWKSPAGLTLLVALAVAASYLLADHTAHVLRALPYLLILACPLMHLFMHRGHHHGGRHREPARSANDDERRHQSDRSSSG